MDRQSRNTTLIVIWLAMACLPTVALGPSKTNKPTPATITGRVTINGKGAAGIVVGVRASEFSGFMQPSIKGTTDGDGNYQISGVSPGSYGVAPIAPAYVLASSEVFPARARAKSLLITEGETINNIDFSLTPGGVITGKISDAEGRPVVEEGVQILFENQPQRGPGFPSVMGNAFMTDDRGIYRVYGIPPGRYRIAVGQADDNPFANTRPGRAAYKRTFYPDATDLKEAQVIEVTEGSEAANIDIVVGRSLPGFTATGKVVDRETGNPVAGMWFGIRRQTQNGPGSINSNAMSNTQGEFRLENIPPGKYSVILRPRDSSAEILADPVPFEVVDHDVTGLLIKTSQGQSITGSIVLENGSDRSVYAKLFEQRLSANVRTGTPNSGQSRQAVMSSDGTFRVGGLAAGAASFYLSSQDRTTRFPLFTVVRIERDGVVQPRGVEIKNGENVSGVKLVINYGSATIRGQVRFVNGELPENARIYVGLKKVGEGGGGNGRPTNVDARGHFMIEGVAAGSYELNANVNLAGRRKTGKQLIDVAEGSANEVDITIDLKPDPAEPPKP